MTFPRDRKFTSSHFSVSKGVLGRGAARFLRGFVTPWENGEYPLEHAR